MDSAAAVTGIWLVDDTTMFPVLQLINVPCSLKVMSCHGVPMVLILLQFCCEHRIFMHLSFLVRCGTWLGPQLLVGTKNGFLLLPSWTKALILCLWEMSQPDMVPVLDLPLADNQSMAISVQMQVKVTTPSTIVLSVLQLPLHRQEGPCLSSCFWPPQHLPEGSNLCLKLPRCLR